MKRFHFSLEKVLLVRAIREQLARVKLARALELMQREEERLATMQERYHQARGLILTRAKEGVTALEMSLHFRYLDVFLGETRIQEGRVAAAQAGAVQARRELLLTRQEKKAMEKLKDRRRQQYRKGVLAEEQKQLDETGVTSFRKVR